MANKKAPEIKLIATTKTKALHTATFGWEVVGSSVGTVLSPAGAEVGAIFRNDSRSVVSVPSKRWTDSTVTFTKGAARGAILLNDAGLRCIACGVGRVDGTLCYEYVAGMHSALDARVACERALGYVGDDVTSCAATTGSSASVGARTQQTIVSPRDNNNVVMGEPSRFADGEGFGDCPASCAACTNASVCSGAVTGGAKACPCERGAQESLVSRRVMTGLSRGTG